MEEESDDEDKSPQWILGFSDNHLLRIELELDRKEKLIQKWEYTSLSKIATGTVRISFFEKVCLFRPRAHLSFLSFRSNNLCQIFRPLSVLSRS